ncbi:MAG: zinc metalloprotease HtpX [archaeon]
MAEIYNQISSNKWKSYLMIAAFIFVILVLGWVFGALTGSAFLGTGIAFIIAIAFSLFGYYFSDSIVLGISQAKEADPKKYQFLHNTVEGLAIAAGIPKPRVYVIEDTALNAFATGRDPKHSAIAVTSGLVETMNRVELEGVIGHEMSHIKNYDTRLMTIAVIFVSVIALMADLILRTFLWGGRGNNENKGGSIGIIIIVAGIILAILAPLIAQLIKLAISRQREYLADASSALLTRYPKGLASALRKIQKDKEPLEAANAATAHLYIANPLKNSKGLFVNLFSTHPPIEERIKRLEAM